MAGYVAVVQPPTSFRSANGRIHSDGQHHRRDAAVYRRLVTGPHDTTTGMPTVTKFKHLTIDSTLVTADSPKSHSHKITKKNYETQRSAKWLMT